jgi:small subunit ribosomal protein S1
LHITDISWGRINHPEEVLKLDQIVKVVVLDFDGEKKRISLGMKQLTPHPWAGLAEDIQIGSKVKGKIRRASRATLSAPPAERVLK